MQEPGDEIYGELLKLLRQIHLFEKQDARDELVSVLPASLRGRITRSSAAWTDLQSIVVECAHWGSLPSGPPILCVLAQHASEMVAGSTFELQLQDWVKSYDRMPKVEPVQILAAVPTVDTIPGLTKGDSLILKLIGDQAIKEGGPYSIGTDLILAQASLQNISEDETFDSLEMLDKRGYIKPLTRNMLKGRYPTAFSVENYGFQRYARQYIPDYVTTFESLCRLIVSEDQTDIQTIIKELDASSVLVRHILKYLKGKQLAVVDEFMGGGMKVRGVSVELKRRVKTNDFRF